MASDYINTPCWPTMNAAAVVTGTRIGAECGTCGHSNIMHSRKLGWCELCRVLALQRRWELRHE